MRTVAPRLLPRHSAAAPEVVLADDWVLDLDRADLGRHRERVLSLLKPTLELSSLKPLQRHSFVIQQVRVQEGLEPLNTIEFLLGFSLPLNSLVHVALVAAVEAFDLFTQIIISSLLRHINLLLRRSFRLPFLLIHILVEHFQRFVLFKTYLSFVEFGPGLAICLR